MLHLLDPVRHRTGIVVPEVCSFWGTSLWPGEDTSAPELPPGAEGSLRLPADYPRLPAALWSRIVGLYRAVLAGEDTPARAADSTCEVMCIFLRGRGGAVPTTSWRVLVPTQKVGGAHVQTNYDSPLVDIETGERHNGLAEAVAGGWIHAGTTHSHGTLGAFYSKTDDESELRQPGMHIVVGVLRPDRYDTVASVVRKGFRFVDILDGPWGVRPMLLADLVEVDDTLDVPFHPAALAQVTRQAPTLYRLGYPRFRSPELGFPSFGGYEGGDIVEDRDYLRVFTLEAGRVAERDWSTLRDGAHYWNRRDEVGKGVPFTRGGFLVGPSVRDDIDQAQVDATVDAYPALRDLSQELSDSMEPELLAATLDAVLDYIPGIREFLDGLLSAP